jgi:bifunctional non-homologous end joining protein LigD
MMRTTFAPLAFIRPCLAQDAQTPPSGEQWAHEIKHDGFRIQALVTPPEVSLLTRNGLDWTRRLGVVVDELAALRVRSAIIDGEAVVLNKNGVADFQALHREARKGGRARIILMAFDLLHLNAVDVRNRPLIERKALLRDALGKRPKSALLRYNDHMLGDGKEVLAGACKLGLEGIISRRLDRPYRSGRSPDWLKSKCLLSGPFVVIGYARMKGASGAIGSLVLGYYDGATLVHAGRVGTGFSEREARAIGEGLQAIRTGEPPTPQRLTHEQRQGVIWVRPQLVAEITYQGWSSDGLLRHSSFKAFLPDMRPGEVHKPISLNRLAELPEPAAKGK